MPTLLDAKTRTSAAGGNALPRPKPVHVNGVTIPRAEIARETQHHPAAKPIDAWTAAVRALVVRELLLQEARRVGLVPEPESDPQDRRETDDEALVRMLVAQNVKTPEPSETECRRFFEANGARFRTPSLYEVRHILLAADTSSESAQACTRAKAEALIAQLEGSPALFADLAALHSACPSAGTGGSLGQIGPGQTVPEFEEAIERSPVGTVAPQPVATRYGLHVVLVDRRIEGMALPFEHVKEAVARWLTEHVRRTAIRQYISLLAGRARIEGIELEADRPAAAIGGWHEPRQSDRTAR